MSKVIIYLEKAWEGLGRYMSTHKLIVLFFVVLLAFWLMERKVISEKQNRLLVYSLIMTVILLLPLTAAAVLVYQTNYYGYEWAWSMVPVTGVIAFGLVMFGEQEIPKKKKLCLFGVMVVILCLCGNQGILGKISPKEQTARGETGEILIQVHELAPSRESVLWGPARVMQEVRRQDGTVLLVYGRDMWDEKAGAYDYEAYSPELTEAYIWLEEVMAHYDLASGLVNPAETMEFLEEQYFWTREAGEHMEVILQAGANTMVFPNLVSRHLEEILESVVADRNKTMEIAYTEEYTVYVIR